MLSGLCRSYALPRNSDVLGSMSFNNASKITRRVQILIRAVRVFVIPVLIPSSPSGPMFCKVVSHGPVGLRPGRRCGDRAQRIQIQLAPAHSRQVCSHFSRTAQRLSECLIGLIIRRVAVRSDGRWPIPCRVEKIENYKTNSSYKGHAGINHRRRSSRQPMLGRLRHGSSRS